MRVAASRQLLDFPAQKLKSSELMRTAAPDPRPPYRPRRD